MLLLRMDHVVAQESYVSERMDGKCLLVTCYQSCDERVLLCREEVRAAHGWESLEEGEAAAAMRAGERARQERALDLAFVVDNTGSMVCSLTVLECTCKPRCNRKLSHLSSGSARPLTGASLSCQDSQCNTC